MSNGSKAFFVDRYKKIPLLLNGGIVLFRTKSPLNLLPLFGGQYLPILLNAK